MIVSNSANGGYLRMLIRHTDERVLRKIDYEQKKQFLVKRQAGELSLNSENRLGQFDKIAVIERHNREFLSLRQVCGDDFYRLLEEQEMEIYQFGMLKAGGV